MAALVATLVIGALRTKPSIVPGRNGAITFVVQGFNRSGNHTDVLDADGSFVANRFGGCPTYSADGTAVAYMTGDDGHVVVAAPDGTVIREFHEITEQTILRPQTFALSPDGEQVAWFKRSNPFYDDAGVAIDGKTELWLLPVDGMPGRLLIAASETNVPLLPVWSADARKIAFKVFEPMSVTDRALTADLYVVDVGNGELRHISSRAAADDGSGVSWSPDGNFIAFTGVPANAPKPELGYTPAGDIYVVAAGGTGEANLTESADSEWHVAWSPDGERLAFLRSNPISDPHLVSQPMSGGRPSGTPIEGPVTDAFTWAPDAYAVAVAGGIAGSR